MIRTPRIRRRARRRGRRLGLKSASSVNFADRKVQASPGTLRQLKFAPKAPIDDIEWMFLEECLERSASLSCWISLTTGGNHLGAAPALLLTLKLTEPEEGIERSGRKISRQPPVAISSGSKSQ
jgi:hypothetical protein